MIIFDGFRERFIHQEVLIMYNFSHFLMRTRAHE